MIPRSPTDRRFSRAELLPALCAVVYNVAEVSSELDHWQVSRTPGFSTLAAAALGALMLFRLRHPVAVAAAALAGDWVVHAPGALVCSLFTVAQRGSARSAWALGALAGATGVLTPWLDGARYALADVSYHVAHTIAFVVVPVVVGTHVRAGEIRIVSLAEHTARLEREQALLAERAQVEERARIAGEMHDVVAHRVTHAVVHAGALRMGADRGPQWVAHTAELIRRSGVEALEELRAVLGVLRPSDEEQTPLLEPPGVRALERLVEGTRATGTPVELDAERPTCGIPLDVRHTVYRIVQEALTNAVKHAPQAPVTVWLRCSSTVYRVRVSNGHSPHPARPVPSGGHGLAGLRERVERLRGSFSAGPVEGGGFRVVAEIPLPETGPGSRTG
ncbi:sensor histidine kinase [Streptomyces gamaensis]|uniref:histidine kinase n=1 Tax=Streptomyces gamaensis TaxID=1763542 RepID=A0ABW0Z3B6_9ACTN